MISKAATLEIPELMQILREELHELPDEKKPGNNTKYQVEDAVMAAFSVFFTQSPSFLDHQRLMKSNKGKDNAESLFSVKAIPSNNQIRNILDPVPATTALPAIMQYNFSPCPLLSKLSDLGMYLIAAVSAVLYL